MDCPRNVSGFKFAYLNKPEDDTCEYCGSLNPETFMSRLEKGDVQIEPTDKNYKVYVKNLNGVPFKQTYRTDEGGTSDQTKWVWTTRETDHTKFYFYHLNEEQQRKFVDLLNEKKLKFDYPGYFYQTPYFITYEKV